MIFFHFTYKRLFIICLYIIIVFSCTKQESYEIRINTIETGINGAVRNIYFNNLDGSPVIYVCGGIRKQFGFIAYNYVGTNNWTKSYTNNRDIVYGLYFFDSTTVYAFGDSLLLLRSNDNGKTWIHKIDMSYFWSMDRSGFRGLYFYNNREAIAISNSNNIKGNIYTTKDGAVTWNSFQNDNGLNDMWVFNDNTILAVGYGIVMKITDIGTKTKRLGMLGDHFTGVWFTNETTGYMCGFNGGIYKTENKGESWNMVFKDNNLLRKRYNFYDIVFISPNIGFVCGTNGSIFMTTNAGKTWKKIHAQIETDLYSMSVNNKILYCTSENGKIYFCGIDNF
ncbi:MAG: hypothetical protein SNJ71_06730 [Bacteroidales bacterium]